MSIQFLVSYCIAFYMEVQGLTLSWSLYFVSMMVFICYFLRIHFLTFFLFKLTRASNGLMTLAHTVSKFIGKHYADFQNLTS